MLPEEKRQQLDGIVNQMINNKEPDSNIQFVVDDFKTKYSVEDKPQETSQPTLKENLKSINPVELYKGAGKGALDTLDDLSQLGQKTIGKVADKIAGKLTGKEVESKPVSIPEKYTKAESLGEKIGKGTEQVSEFFTPLGIESKIAKGASKIDKAKSIIQGALKTGLVSGVQEQDAEDAGVSSLIALGLGSAVSTTSKVIKPIKEILSQKVPSRIMNSIIKPGVNDFNFGKDPGGAVVKEGIKGKSLKNLFNKISSRTNQVGTDIEKEISKVNKNKIDLTPSISKIDDFISEATNQGEQALVTRLQSIKNGLTKTFKNIDGKLVESGDKKLVVSPLEAWKVKKDLGKAAKWTNQAFDREANQARVAVYHSITEELEKLAPSLKGLNKRYSNLLTASKAAQRRLDTVQKFAKLSFGDITSLGAGGLAGGIPGAVATAGARRALGSTAVQSNIAQLLSKLKPQERSVIEKILPAIQKIYLGIDND